MTDTNLLVRGSSARRQFQLRDKRAGNLGGWFSRFLKHHVPIGYEDETGFHYGTAPIPNEAVTCCMPGRMMDVVLPQGDLTCKQSQIMSAATKRLDFF